MPKDDEVKAALIAALATAANAEARFGARVDVRPELNERWHRVVDLIEQLCRKPKK